MKSQRNVSRRRLKAASALLLLALGAGAASANGNAENGAKIFKKCAACHTVGEGQPSRMGPNLFGLFGRNVGTVEGFRYSDTYKAAAEAGDRWTPEKFAEFIAQPRDMYPRSSMVLAVKDEQDITDLTAFLLQASPGYVEEQTN